MAVNATYFHMLLAVIKRLLGNQESGNSKLDTGLDDSEAF